LAAFYDATVFTQKIYIIKEDDYLADTTCKEGNTGCYSATNDIIVYNPAFSANVANPGAITLII